MSLEFLLIGLSYVNYSIIRYFRIFVILIRIFKFRLFFKLCNYIIFFLKDNFIEFVFYEVLVEKI